MKKKRLYAENILTIYEPKISLRRKLHTIFSEIEIR